jgi:nitrogenase molybdenum-cofactor synthesis protein NifE
MAVPMLDERKKSISCGGGSGHSIACGKESTAGAMSQRACVFCGARVVLNPITDAFHIIHGPIGCSSYTWDIRGSLTSGNDLFRHSFCTDMNDMDVVFGGEKKLARAIDQAVSTHHPKVIFVYATCIAGVIGDDVESVCKAAEQRHQIRCIPVQAPGFSGHKAQGYRLAGDAIMALIGTRPFPRAKAHGINILGDFNLAGEQWIVKNYLKSLGIDVVTGITGDSNCAELMQAPQAQLNVVQCAGSMIALARRMEADLNIPYIKVSFYGIEDTSTSLVHIAQALGNPDIVDRTKRFCQFQINQLKPIVKRYKSQLSGKKAAIFVGGGFKAISLIKQFRELGIQTVMVGTQTGSAEDYDVIRSLVHDDCVVLDDATATELEKFMTERGADILVGGVKERPLAYKLGVAFCDHNHERKHPLAGYVGVRNFAEEINASINSPVWAYV